MAHLSGFELWRRTGRLVPISGGAPDADVEIDPGLDPGDAPDAGAPDTSDAQGQDSGGQPEGQVPEGDDEYEGLPSAPDGETVPRSVLEETRREAARRRTALREYESLGVSPAEIHDLVNFRSRLRTDEGARNVWLGLGKSLGLNERDMARFFESQTGQARTRSAEPDDEWDEEPEQGADANTPPAWWVAEQQRLQAEQQRQQLYTDIQQTVAAEFAALGVAPDQRQLQDDVLARADRIMAQLPYEPMTPERARRALRSAWESMLRDYPGLARTPEPAASNGNGHAPPEQQPSREPSVERTARRAASSPRPLRASSGGTPGSAEDEGDHDLDEGKRRARERYRALGLM